MIPDKFKELVLQAAEYTYKRSFKKKGLGSGSESEFDNVDCAVCMDKLKESSTGGTDENLSMDENER